MAKRSKTPIDEIAEDAIRRIREQAEREKMHAVESAQQDQRKRGPRPGVGGRPRMGAERKEKHAFSLDPSVMRWVESQRLPDESMSQTMERVLREAMIGKPKN